MTFLAMMNALFSIQRTFKGSDFGIENVDGQDYIVARLPISDTNAELYRQGLAMFSPRT